MLTLHKSSPASSQHLLRGYRRSTTNTKAKPASISLSWLLPTFVKTTPTATELKLIITLCCRVIYLHFSYACCCLLHSRARTDSDAPRNRRWKLLSAYNKTCRSSVNVWDEPSFCFHFCRTQFSTRVTQQFCVCLIVVYCPLGCWGGGLLHVAGRPVALRPVAAT